MERKYKSYIFRNEWFNIWIDTYQYNNRFQIQKFFFLRNIKFVIQ